MSTSLSSQLQQNFFLSKDDWITCNFGRQYYTGACFASGLSLVALFALARRSFRIGNQNVKLAVEKLSSVKLQQKVDILEKYAPTSSSSKNSIKTQFNKEDFMKQQMEFAKDMYYSDFASWLTIRLCLFSASIQFVKFSFAWYRAGEFNYDEYLGEKVADNILSTATITESKGDDNKTSWKSVETTATQEEEEKLLKLDLDLFQAAWKLQALKDFQRVVVLEQQLVLKDNHKNSDDFQQSSSTDSVNRQHMKTAALHHHDTAFPQSSPSSTSSITMSNHPEVNVFTELDTKTGRIGTMKLTTTSSSSSGENNSQSSTFSSSSVLSKVEAESMPTFWDGVVVGIFGSPVDCDVPRKPMMSYLNLKGGRKRWRGGV